MTFLSLSELHDQIEESGTADALYAQVAVKLDCPLSDARSYIAGVRDVALAGFHHHPEALEMMLCAGFVNGYVIGERDGRRAS